MYPLRNVEQIRFHVLQGMTMDLAVSDNAGIAEDAAEGTAVWIVHEGKVTHSEKRVEQACQVG